MPAIEFYDTNSMKESGKAAFQKFYEEQVVNCYILRMKDELIKYCKADVEILRESIVTANDVHSWNV